MSQPLVRELSPSEDDDFGLPLRRWIGEETRRGLPPYVYKYYLNRTRAFRRQSFKVSLCHTLHCALGRCVLDLIKFLPG
jgi:hypothetical protein